jgi:hypothetical protein
MAARRRATRIIPFMMSWNRREAIAVIASQRVGARAPPDDRLREAIHEATKKDWIASSLPLLAMTMETEV